jgi:hypothetical protein
MEASCETEVNSHRALTSIQSLINAHVVVINAAAKTGLGGESGGSRSHIHGWRADNDSWWIKTILSVRDYSLAHLPSFLETSLFLGKEL